MAILWPDSSVVVNKTWSDLGTGNGGGGEQPFLVGNSSEEER